MIRLFSAKAGLKNYKLKRNINYGLFLQNKKEMLH